MYRILDWDSEFFGIEGGRIEPGSLNRGELKGLLDSAKRAFVKVLYWSVAPSDVEANRAALLFGGILVDEKTMYKKDIDEKLIVGIVQDKNVHAYKEKVAAPEIESLAIQCGEHSRFKTDKGFDGGQFEMLYKTWIHNSIIKECADEVFVYEMEGSIRGMITATHVGTCGSIGLFAVDAKSRRMGIGKALLAALTAYLYDKGYITIQVVTQGKNIMSCSFYEKNGFVKEEVKNFYHFWL